jgi:hypothetical protein
LFHPGQNDQGNFDKKAIQNPIYSQRHHFSVCESEFHPLFFKSALIVPKIFYPAVSIFFESAWFVLKKVD